MNNKLWWGDKSRVDGSQVHLRTRITSISAVTKIEIFVNGVLQKTYNEDRKETDDFLSLSTGQYEIKVRAENNKGKSSETAINVAVNQDFAQPTTTP